ncbi:MAG: hypothetical protein J6D30_05435 [Clostridia bacterium]|nr:hypothetical protein [Clostridia bacterium]
MAGYFCLEQDWESVFKALQGSSYDRCVFHCNNDVVDHQVCVFQFEGGVTASHTMTAFSNEIYRDIKIHGTKAELVGIMEKKFLEVRPFGGESEQIEFDETNICGGHGGGDNGMMHEIYKEYNGIKSVNVTYLEESIESHKMAFGAETARLMETSVQLK